MFTNFIQTGGTDNGTYLLQVVANGIASSPALFVLANNSDSNVTLQTDPANGDYQVLFNGTAVNEYAPGSFSNVFVVLGTGYTTVDINETPAGVPVTVDGNGIDTVHVGDSGGVQSIQGNVYLENVPYYNSVVIEDTGDTASISRQVSITTAYDNVGDAWGTVTGLAPASINYRLCGYGFGHRPRRRLGGLQLHDHRRCLVPKPGPQRRSWQRHVQRSGHRSHRQHRRWRRHQPGEHRQRHRERHLWSRECQRHRRR